MEVVEVVEVVEVAEVVEVVEVVEESGGVAVELLDSSSTSVMLTWLEFWESIPAVLAETLVSGSSGCSLLPLGSLGDTVLVTSPRSSDPSLESLSWLVTFSPSSVYVAIEPYALPEL